jgi:hypothetical protein
VSAESGGARANCTSNSSIVADNQLGLCKLQGTVGQAATGS